MKSILSTLSALILTLTLAACNEGPINGHLDGQWQIMTVDYPDGSSLAPDRYYFCFYRHTANLTHYGETTLPANLVYDPSSGALSLDLPSDHDWLGGWGIRRHTPTVLNFQIVSLSRNKLIMTLDTTATFSLRKF